MPVRRAISEYFGIYSITLTCCRWKNLFEEADGYDVVYEWFDYLKSKGHFVLGYVIMPNHLHAVLGFRHTQGESINKIVGNGKRFMAYGLIKRLEKGNFIQTLKELSTFVNATERRRGKLHEVFEPSFDWKECLDDDFIEQKLSYIHNNPCSGKWELADYPWEYVHSSAKQYSTREPGVYPITIYSVLKDIDLTKHFDLLT
jgi:REP element-mobilizing transposase RayT